MNTRTYILLLVMFLTITTIAFGQPAGGGPPGGPAGGAPPCWPPPCVPVDSGIGALIALGVSFGLKKYYDLRPKRK